MNAVLCLVRSSLLLTALAFAVLAFACDSGDGAGVCAPGETQTCVCPDGSGAQSCTSAGSGWEACVCSGGGNNNSDASVTEADATANTTPDTGTANPPDTPGGGTPDAGPAACTPKADKACDGDTLVWLDSCGDFDENIESCAPAGYCSEGECIAACAHQAEKRCKGNDVYWFDSCGAEEGQAEACEPDEFCDGCDADDETCAKEGQCVKGVLTGTWQVTADPATKDACGMGNASFLPVMMDLEVVGTTVTGHADVLQFSIDYSGTIDGKHLTMTGYYTETSNVLGQTITVDHTEEYDVNFSDMDTFSGNNADSFVMALGALGDIPCTLYWSVTGVKQ